MTHPPFISIIITVLNGAKTIEACLESIAMQTFTDYELVLVDGGSKDQTVELINKCFIKNKTLKVVPGIGLYAGLNMGIKESVGKWLYFLGADDALHSKNTLNKVVDAINHKRPDTRVIVGEVKFMKQNYVHRPMFGPAYLMRHQVHHQGVFYDRDLFKALLYDETMRIASDYEFNLKLALLGIAHEAMNFIICDFGGDGVSENQMKRGYAEMQQIHRRLFKGLLGNWVVNYFWLRRKTGAIIRRFDLLKIRDGIKKVFG
jgi:putative colanic acid biosynthesis glycosyltransferase